MARRTGHDAGAGAEIGTDGPTIEEISHLIPALWRTLRRATRTSERIPALESQVSILRKLVALGPMAPGRLADELHLARPTISNLLTALEADGIVERRPSPTDGRSVMVAATPHGREVLLAFRRGRAEVLQRAMHRLDHGDRERIVAALPSMQALLHELEQHADADHRDA